MKNVVAIMYDFDKTLCDRDMQEYGFIPSIGETPKIFWEETTKCSNENNMDKILSYMFQMVRFAKDKKVALTRDFLNKCGKSVILFEGVTEWFTKINEYGKSLGLNIEHYIISSGLKEIIEGTKIAKEFKQIYACEFLYDENGNAIWPKTNVNYTTKTQYLFRINKGITDVNDDYNLNSYMEISERPIPYNNMIYMGDGITDVPCMRLVKANGGTSIAIYQEGNKKTMHKLLLDDRVDFAFASDYKESSKLYKTMQAILEEMSLRLNLENIKEENKSL